MAKIYKVLTTGGIPKSTFVSYIDGGYAVTDTELSFLKENGLALYPDSAKAFSTIVNRIPSGIGTYDPTARTIEQMYRSVWLRLAEVPQVILTKQQQHALKQAKTVVKAYYTTYQTYQTAYQNKSNAVSTILLEAKRGPGYEAKLRQAKQAQEKALQDWEIRGHRGPVEAAIATVNRLQSLGYQGILEDLENTFDNYKSSFTDSDGNNFVPVELIPSDFASKEVNWNTFTFESSEIDRYKSYTKVNWGGGFFEMEDLFWLKVHVDGEDKRQYQSIKLDSFSLTFEYARVAIDRSAWFDTSILQSQSWWWPGASKTHPTAGGVIFSDGRSTKVNQGEWLMIPNDILFVRNLSIEFDASDESTRKTLDKMHSSAEAGFLIFPIGGVHVSYDHSTYHYHFTHSNSGIKAPQMQMRAFICNLMPKEPNPNIDLLPDSAELPNPMLDILSFTQLKAVNCQDPPILTELTPEEEALFTFAEGGSREKAIAVLKWLGITVAAALVFKAIDCLQHSLISGTKCLTGGLTDKQKAEIALRAERLRSLSAPEVWKTLGDNGVRTLKWSAEQQVYTIEFLQKGLDRGTPFDMPATERQEFN
jgi:hypothetical protein